MSYKDELDLWISEMETKISNLKKHADKKEEIITKKVSSLISLAEERASETGKIKLKNRISSLLKKVSYYSLTLEEVEKEVEKLYGEQSENTTWYFSRRDGDRFSSTFPKKSYDIPPDQYRLKSPEFDEYDERESNTSPKYQNREAMMPDGGDPAYFTNNDIDTWHQQVDLDGPHIETHGFSQWDQEPDEEAHVIQDRDRGVPSLASPEVSKYWND